MKEFVEGFSSFFIVWNDIPFSVSVILSLDLILFDFIGFYLLTWIMKVDFLQITRLSPTSFNISLPRKTQITPRYAKPQKKKNIKTKCLHSNIKLNIHFWLNRCNGTVFIYLHSTYYNSSPKAIVI